MTTTNPTTLDLDAIEARAAAATPGPWHGEHEFYDGRFRPCVSIGDFGWVCSGGEYGPEYDVDSEQGKADAEFIAHARADIPALLAEARRLRAYTETTRYHQQHHAEALRELERLRTERDMLAKAVVHPDRLVDATKLDAAPTTYALPDEPPPEVVELWDRHGRRWVCAVPPSPDIDSPSHWEVPGEERATLQPWYTLLGRHGPLSTVPPAGTEADDA